MSAKGKVSIAALLVTAFVAGVLFTTAGANFFDSGDRVATPTLAESGSTALPQSAVASSLAFQEAFTKVSNNVNPAVVQIQAEKVVQRRNPFEGSPFEDFFGRPGPRRSQGLGSGVVIRSDGYIVTNNHVVEDAEDLQVKMFDGTLHDAEIVGADAPSDLAVIKIDETGLPAVSFGDSEQLQAGQWVLAFGSPLSANLSNTVTAGIVSAVGRIRQGRRSNDPGAIKNYVQTDAAINPGNSGGPLVDLQGQLVGINTAIASQTGGYQGIGFAIPANTVERVATQLIDRGEVRRARLGITYGPVPTSMVQNEDLPPGSAYVGEVVDGGPADEAGLQQGDIIIAIDGQELSDYLQVGNIIASNQPGESVEITVDRDGERRSFTVELGAQEDGEPMASASGQDGSGSPSGGIESQLGFTYQDVTPRIARQLGLEEARGVIVTDVDPRNDIIDGSGIQPRMIIVEMAGQPVTDADAFEEIYQGIEPGEAFRMQMMTPDGQMFLTSIRKPSNS
jgi:serine protease Do